MWHVLDDFLMVSKTDETANRRLETFVGLCQELKIQVVADKIERGMCIALPESHPRHNQGGGLITHYLVI